MTLYELDRLMIIHKREMVTITNGSHRTKADRLEHWCEYYGDYEIKFIEQGEDYLNINVR